MSNLFTIGHSKHTQDYFLRLLKKYNINYLLDVRSTPYSKYAEQYNKESICTFLKREDIVYSFMGNSLGARPTDNTLYSEQGYLDFEKVAESEKFNKAIDNVLLGLSKKNKIALMCTEKDPFECHRAILIARAFSKRGVEVNHILADGSIQTQRELDNRLLEKYFPDWNQLSIFNYKNNIDEKEYLDQAYRKRNIDIGYNLKEE